MKMSNSSLARKEPEMNMNNPMTEVRLISEMKVITPYTARIGHCSGGETTWEEIPGHKIEMPCTVKHHCAFQATHSHQVASARWYLGEYAQYPKALHITETLPKKVRQRKVEMNSYTIAPDSLHYLTIEVEGVEVYDSRVDVPCDMQMYAATQKEFAPPKEMTEWFANRGATLR